MISVLIPTYKYNIFPLVKKLHGMLLNEQVDFEIICLDDGSGKGKINNLNQQINGLSNSVFSELEKNIGRSAIRNLLAKKAKYDWLIFLDADVMPKYDNFFSRYLRGINSDTEVVYGGIEYPQQKPHSTQLLRWKYGKKREALTVEERLEKPYISFLTMGFLIRKKLFERLQFNESIKMYGHEDTLFSYQLMQTGVKIKHIDNPVIHYGMETNEVFMEKSIFSLQSAINLESQKLLPSNYIRILRVYKKLKKLKLLFLINLWGLIFEHRWSKNLRNGHAKLRTFDYFRLYYLHKMKNA